MPETDLLAAPSLCNSTECAGCGNPKTYLGKPSSSLICCDDCWRAMPAQLRAAFLHDDKRLPESPDGATIAERQIALWLTSTPR